MSPSGAPPPSQTRLAYASLKSPSIPDEKPLTTSAASLYSSTSVVTTNKPVTSPSVSPSGVPPVSPTILAYSLSSSVSQEKPVQPSIWYQPVPSPSDYLADKTSVYGATAKSPKSPMADSVPDICLSNLWKYCKFGKFCPHMHYYLPYCWQINKGTGWEDMSDMEQVEKQYCNPNLDSCRVPLIDFLTMRSGTHGVRRLSTVSSVVKPAEYVLTTEWLWYWKDEYGTWTQYGHSNVKQVSSNILSSDLENVYLSDPNEVTFFAAGNQHYEIRFREMKQKNLTYMTEKDVRRRPKFLSFEDVKLLKGSTKSAATSPLKSGTSPLKTDLYPKTWEAGAMPEIGCQKVPVSDLSREFSEIVSTFTKTVSGHKVKKMWRLQNPSLWQVFQWQKEQMKKTHQGQDVKEIRLFHGTEKMHIDAICNQNFDWRICGTHGTVYGQGSYFARDASYSHNYSTPTVGGTRTMFVARVLVGDYVVGGPQMKRPPQRPGGSGRYYDSCVDNSISPSIYVVFEKYQIYPEYLLEYEEQQKKSCAIC
ncbi:Zinc finger CCCH-type antiviral [Pristimantis euphronides]